MDWVSIGKRIRAKRESLGYSREKLAELLDVTPKFCSDIELGVKGMSVPTLCKISDVLGLSSDYILFDLDDHSNIGLMARNCPPDKQEQLETIVRAYLDAVQ